MAAAGLEGGGVAGVGDRMDRAEEGGYRFEAYAENYGHAVGDSALDSAGVIGPASRLSVGAGSEFVNHLGAAPQASFKSHSKFNGFGCGDGHHCVGEHGVKSMEMRRADSGGHSGDLTFNDAADGVAFLFYAGNQLGHA